MNLKEKYNKELDGKIFITRSSLSYEDYVEYYFHKNCTSEEEETAVLIKWKKSSYSYAYSYLEVFTLINNGDWIIINTKNLLIEKSNIENYGFVRRNK